MRDELSRHFPFGTLIPYDKILEKKLDVEIFSSACEQKYAADRGAPPLPATRIIIVGLPRTGSTFFHKLLALDAGARAPRNVELKFPLRTKLADETTGSRGVFAWIVDAFFWLVPRLKDIHFVGAHEPDECVQGFLDGALPDYYVWGCFSMPSAYEFYLAASMRAVRKLQEAADAAVRARLSAGESSVRAAYASLAQVAPSYAQAGGRARNLFLWR